MHELFQHRKSTREFQQEEVSQEDINHVLEAGRHAPSSMNLQPWHFILIQDKNTILNIMNLCFYGNYREHPHTAIALVLNKERRPRERLHSDFEYKFMPYLNYINIGMPALAMALEATARNLHSCIKTPVASAEMRTLLNLPEHLECPIVVVLGKEKEDAHQFSRNRKPLSELLHYEQFGKQTPTQGRT